MLQGLTSSNGHGLGLRYYMQARLRGFMVACPKVPVDRLAVSVDYYII